MSDQKTNTGRQPNGRFAPGNAGGPGNPFARQVAALRKALLESVTPEDIKAIIQAIADRARGGHVGAAKLLLAYTVGTPDKTVDPDQLDLQEWQLFKDAGAALTELPDIIGRPGAGVPLTLVRAARPKVEEAMSRQLAEGLAGVTPTEEVALVPPSPNGKNGPPPSPNGKNGHLAPSANGKNGVRPR